VFKRTAAAFDARQTADRILEEIDKCATYDTVHQLPAALGPVKTMLTYLEDLVLYNWLEVAVEGEVEVGTSYFVRTEVPRQKYTKKSWYDNVQRSCIEKGNELVDTTFAAFKFQVKRVSRKVLGLIFGEKHGDRMRDVLFPDLDEMVEIDLRSVDSEIIGCALALPPPTDMTPTEVRALFELWHREDNRPIEIRRRACYDDVAAAFASQAAKAKGNNAKMAKLAHRARMPHLLPKHFYDFDFFLLFPEMPADADDVERARFKCPKVCKLSIWPENCPGLGQNLVMEPLMLPFDEERGGVLASMATAVMDDGDDDIDTAEDPRRAWDAYPSAEFRGYKCRINVATDFNYSFNFQMDGRLFLDHNTFYSEEEELQREYFRRVRFGDRGRVYTYNPLKTLGLAI